MWYGAWVAIPTHTFPGLESGSQSFLDNAEGGQMMESLPEVASFGAIVVVVALHRALLLPQMILQRRPLVQAGEQTSH